MIRGDLSIKTRLHWDLSEEKGRENTTVRVLDYHLSLRLLFRVPWHAEASIALRGYPRIVEDMIV